MTGDDDDDRQSIRPSDAELLAAAEAEAAERDLDDERGHLLRAREVVASAEEIREAERDMRDEVDWSPPAAPRQTASPAKAPVGFYRDRATGELKPDGWPGPNVPPKRAAASARRITPSSVPSQVSRETRRDDPTAGLPDSPPPISLDDYGIARDNHLPSQRPARPADPVAARPMPPTPPSAPMYVKIDGRAVETPEWEEYGRRWVAYCKAEEAWRAREGRPPRRLLPLDEGDIPGRNTTFDLSDFGPEKLDADGRPLRGPPGGTVRKPMKPWTGLP
ncbi:MAG: hypothetical protein K2Y27_35165 [Xanthobacteraceae bacterium]|nr:hypothetical protein [Xanthobacteraceae bacterium]